MSVVFGNRAKLRARHMTDRDELIAQLVRIEEQLRDLAYDRLRAAATDGDANAAADEKKVQQARRGIEKAIRALGGTPESPFG
ncbi:MAG TPA: hypothetical protein VHP57_07880 [Acidimicrobiia bacterium]|nr:hypothetical protein [Acidimicrobiia bacterium]